MYQFAAPTSYNLKCFGHKHILNRFVQIGYQIAALELYFAAPIYIVSKLRFCCTASCYRYIDKHNHHHHHHHHTVQVAICTCIVYEPATCTGGFVNRSTDAYTACTVCNLHCVVVVEVVVVVVVYIQSQTVYLHSGGYPSRLHTVPGNECQREAYAATLSSCQRF